MYLWYVEYGLQIEAETPAKKEEILAGIVHNLNEKGYLVLCHPAAGTIKAYGDTYSEIKADVLDEIKQYHIKWLGGGSRNIESLETNKMR